MLMDLWYSIPKWPKKIAGMLMIIVPLYILMISAGVPWWLPLAVVSALVWLALAIVLLVE